MNLTVLSLFLGSTSHSPLFNHAGLTLSSVRVSRHFSPIVYDFSSRLQRLSLTRSQFQHVLSPPVAIASKSEYQHEKFTSTLKLDKTERTYYVEDCLFLDCRNGGGSGGGLSIDATESTLKVTRCGFRGCSADSAGGAIYTNAAYVDLISVCATKCSASKYPGFYLNAGKEVTMTHCHITEFDNEETTSASSSLVCDQTSAVKNSNFSRNSLKSADSVFAFYAKTLKVTQLQFEQNTCKSIIHLKAASMTELTLMNFCRNEGKEYLINIDSATYSITFRNCYFQEDRSEYYVNKYCTFADCVFQDEAGAVEKKFTGGSPQTRDCKFGSSETGDMQISNQQACWGTPDTPGPSEVPPRTETVRQGISPGLVFGIIFLLVVVGLSAFFIQRRMCRRQYKDTQLLMYV